MRTTEEIRDKRTLFENAPGTPRNLAILAVIGDALAIRADIDAETAAAAAAVIPGDILSVAPYDAWVWCDGTAQYLDPDTDAPRQEVQVEPTDEEAKK